MSTDIFRTRDGQELAVSAVCDGGDQGCGGGLLLLMLQAMKHLDIITHELTGIYLQLMASKRDALLFRVGFLGLICNQEFRCLSHYR